MQVVALCSETEIKGTQADHRLEGSPTENALGNLALDAGIDVLFDDRDARPGVMFADMELIGIPHRVVVGERSFDRGEIEYRGRTDSENQMLPLDKFVDFIRNTIAAETGP